MEKERENKGLFSGLNFKEVVIYSAVGALLVGGSIYLGAKMVKNTIASGEEKKSLEPDSNATYAKQIKMAFENDGWWGTDEQALRRTLRNIPDKKTFREVAASYKRLYSSPLTKDMQDELTTSEYTEMMMIVTAKPEKKGDKAVYNYIAWAKRLYAATSVYYWVFPGTDEDAIKAVFLEIPTQSAFKKVREAYRDEYGSELLDDLSGDLAYTDLIEMMNIIYKKPKT